MLLAFIYLGRAPNIFISFGTEKMYVYGNQGSTVLQVAKWVNFPWFDLLSVKID
jgi:hypothetical protein